MVLAQEALISSRMLREVLENQGEGLRRALAQVRVHARPPATVCSGPPPQSLVSSLS